jgi:hypothetical protein
MNFDILPINFKLLQTIQKMKSCQGRFGGGGPENLKTASQEYVTSATR